MRPMMRTPAADAAQPQHSGTDPELLDYPEISSAISELDFNGIKHRNAAGIIAGQRGDGLFSTSKMGCQTSVAIPPYSRTG